MRTSVALFSYDCSHHSFIMRIAIAPPRLSPQRSRPPFQKDQVSPLQHSLENSSAYKISCSEASTFTCLGRPPSKIAPSDIFFDGQDTFDNVPPPFVPLRSRWPIASEPVGLCSPSGKLQKLWLPLQRGVPMRSR